MPPNERDNRTSCRDTASLSTPTFGEDMMPHQKLTESENCQIANIITKSDKGVALNPLRPILPEGLAATNSTSS